VLGVVAYLIQRQSNRSQEESKLIHPITLSDGAVGREDGGGERGVGSQPSTHPTTQSQSQFQSREALEFRQVVDESDESDGSLEEHQLEEEKEEELMVTDSEGGGATRGVRDHDHGGGSGSVELSEEEDERERRRFDSLDDSFADSFEADDEISLEFSDDVDSGADLTWSSNTHHNHGDDLMSSLPGRSQSLSFCNSSLGSGSPGDSSGEGSLSQSGSERDLCRSGSSNNSSSQSRFRSNSLSS
jgi:hypothetical protein